MTSIKRFVGGFFAVLLAAVHLMVAVPAQRAHAIVPGGNGKIVYIQEQGTNSNVYTINPDGTGATNLTSGGTNLYPVWSPDGTKILYVESSDHLVIMNADGSNKTPVPLAGFTYATEPDWSPDGNRFVFLGMPTGGSHENLYTAAIDGSDVRQITNYQLDFSAPGNPRWSPNGDKIAFSFFLGGSSAGAGAGDIYTMNTDGTGLTALTNDIPNLTRVFNHAPAWSPDGSKIAYSHDQWLWTMNADGSNKAQLTFGPAVRDRTFNVEPMYSPDGTKIVYGANLLPNGFTRSLHIMNADGTNSTTLVSAGGYYADWQAVHQDSTPPTVTPSLNPQPNVLGWNNTSVLLHWDIRDPDSTVTNQQGCADVTVSSETAGTTYACTATSSGGTTTQSVTIRMDASGPVLATPTWTQNPKALTDTATLTIPATDALSGIQKAEYFIGDTDPGVGNGVPMTVSAQNGGLSADLTASFGTNFQPGVYKITARSMDNADNWGPAITTMLVVYDANTPLAMIGKNKRDLTPSLANGDVLPGLIAAGQTDAADFGFSVQYKNGAIDSHSDLQFSYQTGTNCGKATAQNCHSFSLNATSIAWLIVNGVNNAHGQFQGMATVTVDGVTTSNLFTIEGDDGDLLNPAQSDHLVLKVYAPGADPAAAAPLYKVSGFIAKGRGVTIR